MSIFKRIKNFFTPDASRYAAKTATEVLKKAAAKAERTAEEPAEPKKPKVAPRWTLLHRSVWWQLTPNRKTKEMEPVRFYKTFSAGRNAQRRLARLSDAARGAMLQARRERQLAGAL